MRTGAPNVRCAVLAHDEQRPSKDLFTAHLYFGDYEDSAESTLPYHYHDSYEIFCSLNESLRYRVNGAVYTMARGDILLLNQFDVHQSLAEPGMPYRRQVTIFFPELISTWGVPGYDLLRNFERRSRGFHHLVRLGSDDFAGFQQAFEQGLGTAGLSDAEREMVQRLAVAEMLIRANRGLRVTPTTPASPTASTDETARFDRILRFVDEHLTEVVTLDRIAREFGTTPNGINRLCRKAGTVTMHQYILRRRIERARLELSSGRTVTEAAYVSGFGNLSHFVRTFRQKTGLSPKQYQRQILERQSRE